MQISVMCDLQSGQGERIWSISSQGNVKSLLAAPVDMVIPLT